MRQEISQKGSVTTPNTEEDTELHSHHQRGETINPQRGGNSRDPHNENPAQKGEEGVIGDKPMQ